MQAFRPHEDQGARTRLLNSVIALNLVRTYQVTRVADLVHFELLADRNRGSKKSMGLSNSGRSV